MNDSYLKIHEDLRQLKADLAAAAGQASGDASAYTSLARERARQKITEIEQQLRQHGQEADVYVREHAWTAVVLSAVIGMVVGLLFSRGRHHD